MNKKQMILDTALKIFFEYGYKKTTLDDIADALKIQKSGIYYYYKSKEALFCDVLLVQHEDYVAYTIKSIREANDLRTAMITYFESKIDYLMRYTNSHFSVTEDVLMQHYFVEDLIERFKQWERQFILEHVLSFIPKRLVSEEAKSRLADMILIEELLLTDISSANPNREEKKAVLMDHLEVFITGIEVQTGLWRSS